MIAVLTIFAVVFGLFSAASPEQSFWGAAAFTAPHAFTAAGVMLMAWREIEIERVEAELKACKELEEKSEELIKLETKVNSQHSPWSSKKQSIDNLLKEVNIRKQALIQTKSMTRHTTRIGVYMAIFGILTMPYQEFFS